jgi:hypothetical protein
MEGEKTRQQKKHSFTLNTKFYSELPTVFLVTYQTLPYGYSAGLTAVKLKFCEGACQIVSFIATIDNRDKD